MLRWSEVTGQRTTSKGGFHGLPQEPDACRYNEWFNSAWKGPKARMALVAVPDMLSTEVREHIVADRASL